jgi:plasmid maintenance system antidote protein VapI
MAKKRTQVEIGECYRARREWLGYDQGEAAEATGVGQATIQNIEYGKAGVAMYRKVSRVYGWIVEAYERLEAGADLTDVEDHSPAAQLDEVKDRITVVEARVIELASEVQQIRLGNHGEAT